MHRGSHTTEAAAEQLTFVPLSPDGYSEWDRFCERSSEAWFWHTSQWLEYTLHYRPELQPRCHSFLCLHEGSVAAICPLIAENRARGTESVREFSSGGDAGPAPAIADSLSDKMRRRVLQGVYGQIDELAGQLQVARASFRMSPLAPAFWKSTTPRPNPFLKQGFCDVSLATQVLDLTGDEQQLLREMRKGHRADVTRAGKMLQAVVLDQDNITPEGFERYRLLHQKAAGRVTRPLATFQMMYEWIRAGFAALCAASLDGKDVGFALLNVYKDGAYYTSSCEDPEHNHLPIGHLLQWRAMQWLKLHAIRRYEIGLQLYSQPHLVVSEKERRISFFKRGFGGTTAPLWRGEKFYDAAYCAAILKERAETYAGTVGSLSADSTGV
jgi:hypothetical protein